MPRIVRLEKLGDNISAEQIKVGNYFLEKLAIRALKFIVELLKLYSEASKPSRSPGSASVFTDFLKQYTALGCIKLQNNDIILNVIYLSLTLHRYI